MQATRQMYVDELLARELPDGGWTLTGGEADVDITAMTLQALAKYREQPEVEAAVERGLAVLSSLQEPDGGYASWGSSNSESVAQVIVALTELGVPLDDARFVKNGVTVEDALCASRRKAVRLYMFWTAAAMTAWRRNRHSMHWPRSIGPKQAKPHSMT